MEPFDERFFDSLGFVSAHMGDRGRIVYNDQAGGHCCLTDGYFITRSCCLRSPLIRAWRASLVG